MTNFLEYKWVRVMLLVVIALLLVSNVFHLLSYLDRRRMRDEFLMQRRMLNARAVIQTTLINAAMRKGEFTDDEKLLVLGLYEQAEYDQAGLTPGK